CCFSSSSTLACNSCSSLGGGGGCRSPISRLKTTNTPSSTPCTATLMTQAGTWRLRMRSPRSSPPVSSRMTGARPIDRGAAISATGFELSMDMIDLGSVVAEQISRFLGALRLPGPLHGCDEFVAIAGGFKALQVDLVAATEPAVQNVGRRDHAQR